MADDRRVDHEIIRLRAGGRYVVRCDDGAIPEVLTGAYIRDAVRFYDPQPVADAAESRTEAAREDSQAYIEGKGLASALTRDLGDGPVWMVERKDMGIPLWLRWRRIGKNPPEWTSDANLADHFKQSERAEAEKDARFLRGELDRKPAWGTVECEVTEHLWVSMPQRSAPVSPPSGGEAFAEIEIDMDARTATTTMLSGDEVEGRDIFDRCDTCGHYRGEHSALTGCLCVVVRATGSEECPCFDFVEPVADDEMGDYEPVPLYATPPTGTDVAGGEREALATDRQLRALDQLDGIATMPIRGRWTVDRVKELQGALRIIARNLRAPVPPEGVEP